MKTSVILLAFVSCLVASARGQNQPPPAAPGADAERQAAVRRALDAAYARMGVTNPAVRGTNPVAAPPTATPPGLNLPGVSTPPAITSPPPAITSAPPAITSAPPALDPSAPAITTAVPGFPNAATNIGAAPPGATAGPPPTAAVVPAVSVPATNVAAPPPTLNPVTPRPIPGTPASVRPAGAAVPGAGSAAVPPRNPRAGSAGPPSPGTPTPAAAVGADDPVSTLSALDDPTEPIDDQVLAPGVIKFQEADMLQVLDIYQELTGRTILRPASLPATKISIRSQTPLTRRQAVQALDSILSLNGIVMIPQGDLFVKAVPFGQATTEAGAFNELPGEVLPESGSFVTHVVQLKNSVPSQLMNALTPLSKLPNSILAIDSSGILVLRDYAENVKRMLELLERVDVVPIQDVEPIVIPIKYALAEDIAQVLSSLTEGGGSATTVGSSPSRTGLTAPPGGLSNTPGGFNPNNPAANRFGAQSGAPGTTPTGSRSSFQDRLRSIVSRAAQGDIVVLGQTKIIADARTNSLLIFASKQDIATIRDIIDKLDVVLPQVLIEAIIMEVRLGDELTYGVSYLQTDPTTRGNFTGIGGIANKDVPFLSPGAFGSMGSNALGGGLTYFARFGNDLEATARAMASDSRINVLSKPRIQTSHAVEANLFVGQTRPYVTGTYFGFSGNPQTQFQQQQIGITLTVLPLINPEGLVVMDIRQKIQSIGREIPIDANFSVPETIDREANAKVSVRDRETVILGGFISSDVDKSKSGVPILKDIPILGNLFRSQTKRNNRNELVVLIRPTVLPTPEEAAIFANEDRSRMPGIVSAEREFSEQQRKRQEAAAKELLRREGFSN